jgi:transposase
MAGKRIELKAHLSAAELKARSRASTGVDAKESRRWLALWHLSQRKSGKEAAAACGLSHTWVCQVARRYNAQGAAGVASGQRRRPGGARATLDPAGKDALAEALAEAPPAELGGGIWSGRKVVAWIAARTGRTLRVQQGCVLLRQLGFRPRVPRPVHPKAATAAEQRAWKKSCGANLRVCGGAIRAPSSSSGSRTRRAWD